MISKYPKGLVSQVKRAAGGSTDVRLIFPSSQSSITPGSRTAAPGTDPDRSRESVRTERGEDGAALAYIHPLRE